MTYKQRMIDCPQQLSNPVVAGSIPAAPTSLIFQSLPVANNDLSIGDLESNGFAESSATPVNARRTDGGPDSHAQTVRESCALVRHYKVNFYLLIGPIYLLLFWGALWLLKVYR